MGSKQNLKKDNDKEKSEETDNGGAGDVVTDFIEDVWQVMTPEMIDRLKCVLTEDMGLSKKDADKFIQSQREIRKQRICLKKDKRIVKIGIRNQWIKELSRDIANQMASFLVGLLLSNRTPRSKVLTEIILGRLCDITEVKTTVDTARTRVQRTMVVIADRMANWIDEAMSNIEKESEEKYKTDRSVEDLMKESVATLESVKTFSSLESEDHILETESDRLIGFEDDEFRSEEEEFKSEEESEEEKEDYDEDKTSEEEGSEEGESEVEEEMEDEEESEEKSEAAESEEEEEVDEEEEKVEEEEEEQEVEEEEVVEEVDDEEEVEEEEETGGEEEVEEEEGEEGEGEEDEGEEVIEEMEEDEEETEKESKLDHLDFLELLREDIERTPKGEGKTDRQMAVKEIIEKRFEDIAREKLEKSIDSIVKFDIDETASIVANWLEKILPSGDILAKESFIPQLLEKQGPAFEVKEGIGSQFQVHKLSSTTVAKKVAEVKGIDFPIRRKKLPRSMSPLNVSSTKDWADWALEAANVGEEWGKWLDTTLANVEEHLLKEKDADTSHLKEHDDWKSWKDTMGIEAQKWRAEKQKIKGEGYLWNKKLQSEKSV